MEIGVNEDIENIQGDRWGGYNAGSLEAVCKDRNPLQLQVGLRPKLLAALKSSPADGVDPNSVEERRSVFGTNEYDHPPGASYLQLVWEQLKDPTILLLVAAATVSTVLGVSLPEQREEKAYVDGIAIWLAVLVVISVGAGNDYHKELQFRKLNAAKDVLNTKVVRGGQRLVVPSTELVVGDIVLLDTGDKVAADGILVEPYRGLCLDESSLTGESDVVHKSKEQPFIISGTQVAEGEGRMLVLAVGPRTEWGRLIALTTGEMDNTPLQDKLAHVAGLVAKIGLSVAIVCFVVLFIFLCVEINGFPTTSSQWMEVLDFFLYAVTIIVVAVPEGLPLAVTISLAYSMRKMMKDNNFVRHLAACETMGGATTICTDKTGTLTQNRMTVVEAWLAGTVVSQPPTLADLPCETVKQLLCDGISANTKAFLVEKDGDVELVGNRTECALLLMLRSWGLDGVQIREASCIEAVGTFTANRKMSSVLVRQALPPGRCPSRGGRDPPAPLCLHVKGAAEIVVSRCQGYLDSKGAYCRFDDSPFGAGSKLLELEDRITAMASRGLRTLAIAVRRSGLGDETVSASKPITELEDKLALVAIVGIKDPVRPAVPDTIQVCYGAGINVKMVTGDNLYTARHIAEECGLLTSDGVTLDGPTFRAMSDDEVLPLLPKLEVLARSSPEDKFRLVSLLRRQREVVAVTGDGTNDAPALKEADVGLSMGVAGTDVAKEASDIVILDDNFGSIVKAVMWGRSIFGNIRKFLQFQLTVNLVALAIAFLAAVTGKGEPLNVLQLLWVNLIMDSLAALALATEDPTPDLLKQKPHGRHEALITNFMKYHILLQSAYQVAWLMFLLYGLPRLSLAPYADLCTVPCDEWDPQQQYEEVAGSGGEETLCLVGAAVSDPTAPGCSNQAAIHDFNHKVGASQEQAIRSLLFNTFIFMQVFNEINSRKLGGELNTLSGIHNNRVFLAVLAITVAMQVVIMETALGGFFKVSPQTWQEWLFAVAVGAGSMLVCLLGKLARTAVMAARASWTGSSSRGQAGVAGGVDEVASSTTMSGRHQVVPEQQYSRAGGTAPVSQELAEVCVTLTVGDSVAGKPGAATWDDVPLW